MTRTKNLKRAAVVLLALMLAANPAAAQQNDPGRARTLADIRQELSVLYVEIQQLKRELSTTGAPGGAGSAGLLSERLDAIEAELRELTARTERLEHRIERIVRDGTNRIGDLEFRLVELEGGDVSKLGETTTLGGDMPGDVAGGALPGDGGAGAESGAGELAVGEQADFDAARKALEDGDAAGAARRLAAFLDTYPGSPLTARAHYLRGRALLQLGRTTDAARAFLTSFSGDPTGPVAADALYELGSALGTLGQTAESCATLAEVPRRFADSPRVADARARRQALGCTDN